MASSYLNKTGLTYLWSKIKVKFLPLTGGTVSGNLTVTGTLKTNTTMTATTSVSTAKVILTSGIEIY